MRACLNDLCILGKRHFAPQQQQKQKQNKTKKLDKKYSKEEEENGEREKHKEKLTSQYFCNTFTQPSMFALHHPGWNKLFHG